MVVVIVTVIYQHAFFLPIFLGLISTAKSLLNNITPKLIVLLLKNSMLIKLQQFFTRGSAHFILLSHRPWRRKLLRLKRQLIKTALRIPRWYMQRKLWIRTVIALVLLVLTASSSYVFIALLIIPQPLVNWVKLQIMTLLNKLGITQFLDTAWRYVIPASWQSRWCIYQKWTLGRRQIKTARRMHSGLSDITLVNKTINGLSTPGTPETLGSKGENSSV